MNQRKLYTTAEASKYLAEAHGINRTGGTLCIYRVKGSGPAFVIVGQRQIRYTQSGLDDYAKVLISGPMFSTSDAAPRTT